ncbi:hypothetical protein [Desertimonas flava]|uniref:hypothetical protein n=1 Tax=Desertimonas flava TaxID=2064846 RepID=UPI000E353D32|nr:hypothetical protein [Desertimonas flava]
MSGIDDDAVRGGDDLADVDERLDELIHRADLDGLVRLIDDRTASRDWPGLRRCRDRARQAVVTGRQVWPAATLAEYRLALVAPAEWAAGVIDDDAGRFTIGPLSEVIAQHHTFVELAPHVSGPAASLIAHERALRGEDVTTAVGRLPNALELPYGVADWEPAYPLATYSDDGVDAPAPPLPDPAGMLRDATTAPAERLDDPPVELAVRQLLEAWTARSNGRAEMASVVGDAGSALHALGLTRSSLTPLSLSDAMAWLAWAGASGGAHGRRRGAALGRFGALWTLATLLDVVDEWPVPLDELGELAGDLCWYWWDAGEPATGWRLQLAIEDRAEGIAWAISARDDA